jgi:hypothetical protein
MPGRDVEAEVAAPGEAHEGRAVETESVEERRDEVGERVGVVRLLVERRRAAEARCVEGDEEDAVARQNRPGWAERQACPRGQADAVPVENRLTGGLAPRANEQPRAVDVDPPFFHPGIIRRRSCAA